MQDRNINGDTGLENIYQQIQSTKTSNLSISRVLQVFTCQSQTQLNSLLNCIAQFITNFNKTVSSELQFSGFLISSNYLIIHFVEGDCESMEALFVEELQHIIKSNVQIDNRILVYNDLYFERIFEYWGNEKLNVQFEIELDALKPEQEVEDAIWKTYQKFLMAGIAIKEKLKEAGNFTNEILKEICNYLQISPKSASYFFTEYSFDMQEYFNVYKKTQLLEDQEGLWPVQLNISDYIEYKDNPYNTINSLKLINQ